MTEIEEIKQDVITEGFLPVFPKHPKGREWPEKLYQRSTIYYERVLYLDLNIDNFNTIWTFLYDSLKKRNIQKSDVSGSSYGDMVVKGTLLESDREWQKRVDVTTRNIISAIKREENRVKEGIPKAKDIGVPPQILPSDPKKRKKLYEYLQKEFGVESGKEKD